MAVQTAKGVVRNSDWIAQAFFTPVGAGGAGDQIRNPFTSAMMSIYDTTPGGNRSINPQAQYCRYSDPRQPSLAVGSAGMGSYYSRAFDEHATRISFRFGVPRFNPLSRFLNNYYDPSLAKLVNTGHVTSSIFSTYNIGKVLGTLFTLPLQVYFGISYLYSRAMSFIQGRPYNQFYYMEPTMPLYWTAVTTLVNKLAVDLGIVHGYEATGLKGSEGSAQPSSGLNSSQIKELNQLLPDVFRDGSYSVIDVKSIASRAQRLQNEYYNVVSNISKNKNLTYAQFSQQIQTQLHQNSVVANNSTYSGLQDYLNTYSDSPTGKDTSNSTLTPQTDGEKDTTTKATNDTIRPQSDEPSLKSLLEGELKDGSAFVTFEVDYNGSISESFSNSTKETGLAAKLNGMAGKYRDLMVNFSGGNVGDGLIASAFETAVGAVKGLVSGALSSIGFSGLSQVAGGGFAELQDVWDQATANLPTESYTLRLHNPNGDKISFLTRIGLPLCCILAGGLPRSTGKASYNSPFICSMESQGRNRISRGIIDSIQISRGTSNIGFTDAGLPVTVDITIGVKNLDRIMHVPIADSLISTLTSFSEFDEDTVLSNYISTLASVNLYDRFYLGPRIKMAWANVEADWDSLTSASNFAQFAASSVPGQIVSGLLNASPKLTGL